MRMFSARRGGVLLKVACLWHGTLRQNTCDSEKLTTHLGGGLLTSRVAFLAMENKTTALVVWCSLGGPQFHFCSSPSRMCRSVASRKDRRHEGREIGTPNLLIWSQTRYRCAIPPHANVTLSVPRGTATPMPFRCWVQNLDGELSPPELVPRPLG